MCHIVYRRAVNNAQDQDKWDVGIIEQSLKKNLIIIN